MKMIAGVSAREYMRVHTAAWRKANPGWRAKWERANPERAYLSKLRGTAKARGVKFNLTLEDIKIPKRCPVLGIPLRIFAGILKHHPDDAVSFDRVNPKRGYVKGNVRAISWRANRIKSNATARELRAIAAYIEAEKE